MIEKKAGPLLGPGPIASPAAVRTTAPAIAELALTGGTMTLVLAPEEHPRPIGLGPNRVALAGIEPIGDHATPVTEALHVPLHLVRGSAALVSQTPLPIPNREPRGRSVAELERNGSGRVPPIAGT